jgi:hypothetical protein
VTVQVLAISRPDFLAMRKALFQVRPFSRALNRGPVPTLLAPMVA